jgi:hypothetical protein
MALNARSRILMLALVPAAMLAPKPAAGADSVPPGPPRLVAGAQCAEGELSNDTTRFEVGGVVFTARPQTTVDYERRLESGVAGSGATFRQSDGSAAPFQVFLLRVENRAKQTVRFQPGNIVRLFGNKQQDHILDYTDLYRYLFEETKDPDALTRLVDAFYDSALALEPGETVERLLFFRELPAKGKRKSLTLLVSAFQIGAETQKAALAWHYEKEKGR